MPTAVTEGIRVTVEATYLPDRSSPDESTYAFAYTVTIANEDAPRVQLRRRHWVITDVGEQPILERGEAHRYSSGAVLATPVGTMEGTYEMHAAGGHVFKANIPRFALQVPGILQ